MWNPVKEMGSTAVIREYPNVTQPHDFFSPLLGPWSASPPAQGPVDGANTAPTQRSLINDMKTFLQIIKGNGVKDWKMFITILQWTCLMPIQLHSLNLLSISVNMRLKLKDSLSNTSQTRAEHRGNRGQWAVPALLWPATFSQGSFYYSRWTWEAVWVSPFQTQSPGTSHTASGCKAITFVGKCGW